MASLSRELSLLMLAGERRRIDPRVCLISTNSPRKTISPWRLGLGTYCHIEIIEVVSTTTKAKSRPLVTTNETSIKSALSI